MNQDTPESNEPGLAPREVADGTTARGGQDALGDEPGRDAGLVGTEGDPAAGEAGSSAQLDLRLMLDEIWESRFIAAGDPPTPEAPTEDVPVRFIPSHEAQPSPRELTPLLSKRPARRVAVSAVLPVVVALLALVVFLPAHDRPRRSAAPTTVATAANASPPRTSAPNPPPSTSVLTTPVPSESVPTTSVPPATATPTTAPPAPQPVVASPTPPPVVRAAAQTFTGIDASLHVVRVHNGNPGFSAVDVDVNGFALRISPLAPGETRSLDVASAMRPGNGNVITVTGLSTSGSAADIVIGPS